MGGSFRLVNKSASGRADHEHGKSHFPFFSLFVPLLVGFEDGPAGMEWCRDERMSGVLWALGKEVCISPRLFGFDTLHRALVLRTCQSGSVNRGILQDLHDSD